MSLCGVAVSGNMSVQELCRTGPALHWLSGSGELTRLSPGRALESRPCPSPRQNSGTGPDDVGE